jgi:hypothetical protein
MVSSLIIGYYRRDHYHQEKNWRGAALIASCAFRSENGGLMWTAVCQT